MHHDDGVAFEDLKDEFLELFIEHMETELEMFSDELERRGHAPMPHPEHAWQNFDHTLSALIALLDEAGEDVDLIQYTIGRYLGEVVRFRFGGEWLRVELNDDDVPEPMLVGHEMDPPEPFNPFAVVARLRCGSGMPDIRAFIEQCVRR
ncbi:TPA: hypothetical protein ACKP39_002824 [Stenotrophomonas maltophilia]